MKLDGRSTELVLRIRSLARRRPTARTRVLRAADLELDTIGRLRRKLGEPPVITTRAGVGYRIADTDRPEPPGDRSDRPR